MFFSPQCLAAFWDAEKGDIVLCDDVDISIAVATEKVHSCLGCYFGYLNTVYLIILVCVAGFDDSNYQECRPEIYFCNFLRGNICLSEVKFIWKAIE